MKRITISLSDELAVALERQARRQGVSVSEVSREALSEQLGLRGRRRLGFAGLGRSGNRHTARDSEAVLAREWSGDRRS